MKRVDLAKGTGYFWADNIVNITHLAKETPSQLIAPLLQCFSEKTRQLWQAVVSTSLG